MKKKELLNLLKDVADDEEINVVDRSCDDEPEENFIGIQTVERIDEHPYIILEGTYLDPMRIG